MALASRVAGMAALGVAALLSAGCLVQVETVRDARPEFARARREASQLQGQRGPAHELNVLVYDAEEKKLVRVSMPMWLVRKVAKHANDGDRLDLDFGPDDERAERAVKRHVRFEDIEKAGLGVLVEVEEDDGEQVLVWLR
jgi:hypothetical protein